MADLQSVFGQGGFATNSVAPATDFSYVPPNKYPVLIEEALVKQTKAGTGHYAELVLVILEGEFRGRKIWDRINIDNPSTKCIEIGRAQLAALGVALEIANLTTVQQLLRGTVVAHVKVKDEQNEVRTYSSLAAYRAAPQQPRQVAQPVTQPVQQVAPQQQAPAQPAYAQPQPQQQPPPSQPNAAYYPQPTASAQQPPAQVPPAQGSTVPWARPQ